MAGQDSVEQGGGQSAVIQIHWGYVPAVGDFVLKWDAVNMQKYPVRAASIVYHEDIGVQRHAMPVKLVFALLLCSSSTRSMRLHPANESIHET